MDALLVGVSFLLAYFLRFHVLVLGDPGPPALTLGRTLWLALVSVPTFYILFAWSGLYGSLRTKAIHELPLTVAKSVALGGLFLGAVIFLVQAKYFSRGLFGKPPDPQHLESVLHELSLWDKRKDMIMTLSGGMKRRVLIAKALAHEPQVLFLDEPTAGVDVELRRDMWALVRRLRDSGVTIILTTHYIDEAEEMADRIGVINKGRLILVETKTELMKKLGKKQLTLHLTEALVAIPEGLSAWALTLANDGSDLEFVFDTSSEQTTVPTLLQRLGELGIGFTDLTTRQSSLEEIFVSLVSDRK